MRCVDFLFFSFFFPGKCSWQQNKFKPFATQIKSHILICFFFFAPSLTTSLSKCEKKKKMIYILEATAQNRSIVQTVRLSVCFMNCSESASLSHALTTGAAMFILSHYSQ